MSNESLLVQQLTPELDATLLIQELHPELDANIFSMPTRIFSKTLEASLQRLTFYCTGDGKGVYRNIKEMSRTSVFTVSDSRTLNSRPR